MFVKRNGSEGILGGGAPLARLPGRNLSKLSIHEFKVTKGEKDQERVSHKRKGAWLGGGKNLAGDGAAAASCRYLKVDGMSCRSNHWGERAIIYGREKKKKGSLVRRVQNSKRLLRKKKNPTVWCGGLTRKKEWRYPARGEQPQLLQEGNNALQESSAGRKQMVGEWEGGG